MRKPTSARAVSARVASARAVAARVASLVPEPLWEASRLTWADEGFFSCLVCVSVKDVERR